MFLRKEISIILLCVLKFPNYQLWIGIKYGIKQRISRICLSDLKLTSLFISSYFLKHTYKICCQFSNYSDSWAES